MKKTNLVWFLVGAIFLFAAFGIYWAHAFHPSAQQAAVAHSLDKSHLFRTNDYLTLLQIQDKISKSGRISDGDLNWMLTQLAVKKSRDTADPAIVHETVAGGLRLIKDMNPDQENRIFQATLPLLNSSEKLDINCALATLGYLRDKRAVPYISPLVNTDHGRLAQKSLDKIAAGPQMGASQAG